MKKVITAPAATDLIPLWRNIGAILGYTKKDKELPRGISRTMLSALVQLEKINEAWKKTWIDQEEDMEKDRIENAYFHYCKEFEKLYKFLAKRSDEALHPKAKEELEKAICSLEKFLKDIGRQLHAKYKKELREPKTRGGRDAHFRIAADILVNVFPELPGITRTKAVDRKKPFNKRKKPKNVTIIVDQDAYVSIAATPEKTFEFKT